MQRLSEFQLQCVFRRRSRKRIVTCAEFPLSRLPAISQGVILHQVHRSLKLAEVRPSHHDRVEAEVTVRVLDAQVRRAELGFHRQGEEVTWVRAVSHQEGTIQSLVQKLLSLGCGDRAPVPACETGNMGQPDVGDYSYQTPTKKSLLLRKFLLILLSEISIHMLNRAIRWKPISTTSTPKSQRFKTSKSSQQSDKRSHHIKSQHKTAT